MIKKLAWVTTRDAHGRDEDEPAVLAALRIKGVSVEVIDWEDTSVNWSQFDRVVLRSAWDYPKRLTEFLSWLDHVASTTEVVNAPKTVRWNLDKQYLIELANAGIPITPTNFVKPGSETVFPSGEFVIKPAIGAGSRDAASYAQDQQEIARAHVARLHAAGQTVLVQPLLKSIDTDGEWPLVFFGGEFSHAANKRVSLPRAGSVEDLFAHETNTSYIATADQIKIASAAIDMVSRQLGTPTYGRVDLVRDNEGQFCILELELIEPSLFLLCTDPKAIDKFVAVLIKN